MGLKFDNFSLLCCCSLDLAHLWTEFNYLSLHLPPPLSLSLFLTLLPHSLFSFLFVFVWLCGLDNFRLTAGAEDLELLLSATGILPSHGQDSPPAGSSKASPEDNGDVLNLATTPEAQDSTRTLSHHKYSVPSDNHRTHPAANNRAMDGMEDGAGVGVGRWVQSSGYRPTRRGSPRPSTHTHFDINEHLPWMIVLLLLLVLVVIVVCSVKRSSRVLKKGPVQDPSSIIEKAIQKKTCPPRQTKEKWIYYSNGQGEWALYFTSQRFIERNATLLISLFLCSRILYKDRKNKTEKKIFLVLRDICETLSRED